MYTASMALKRCASPFQEAPAIKKAKGPASNLRPVGDRTKAVKGVKNPDMLHMLCKDINTGKLKELHFKKLVHAEIDWDRADHIAKINSWRNQLYGRAGLRAKDVTMWTRPEEEWIELYFHLIGVQGTKEGLMLPVSKVVLEDFNAFFVGRVFNNSHGEPQPPRKERILNAFVSKLNRVVLNIRPRIEHMMIGKSGDYYQPVITEPMLEKYSELRRELVNSGVMGHPFTWAVDYEAGDAWADNDAWRTFWNGVCRLPEMIDQEAAQLDVALDEALEILEVDMTEDSVRVEDVSEHGTLNKLATQPDIYSNTSTESSLCGDSSPIVEGNTPTTEPDVSEKNGVDVEMSVKHAEGAAVPEHTVVVAAATVGVVHHDDGAGDMETDSGTTEAQGT